MLIETNNHSNSDLVSQPAWWSFYGTNRFRPFFHKIVEDGEFGQGSFILLNNYDQIEEPVGLFVTSNIAIGIVNEKYHFRGTLDDWLDDFSKPIIDKNKNILLLLICTNPHLSAAADRVRRANSYNEIIKNKHQRNKKILIFVLDGTKEVVSHSIDFIKSNGGA